MSGTARGPRRSRSPRWRASCGTWSPPRDRRPPLGPAPGFPCLRPRGAGCGRARARRGHRLGAGGPGAGVVWPRTWWWWPATCSTVRIRPPERWSRSPGGWSCSGPRSPETPVLMVAGPRDTPRRPGRSGCARGARHLPQRGGRGGPAALDPPGAARPARRLVPYRAAVREPALHAGAGSPGALEPPGAPRAGGIGGRAGGLRGSRGLGLRGAGRRAPAPPGRRERPVLGLAGAGGAGPVGRGGRREGLPDGGSGARRDHLPPHPRARRGRAGADPRRSRRSGPTAPARGRGHAGGAGRASPGKIVRLRLEGVEPEGPPLPPGRAAPRAAPGALHLAVEAGREPRVPAEAWLPSDAPALLRDALDGRVGPGRRRGRPRRRSSCARWCPSPASRRLPAEPVGALEAVDGEVAGRGQGEHVRPAGAHRHDRRCGTLAPGRGGAAADAAWQAWAGALGRLWAGRGGRDAGRARSTRPWRPWPRCGGWAWSTAALERARDMGVPGARTRPASRAHRAGPARCAWTRSWSRAELRSAERELRAIRADAAEVDGDLEVATMDWHRERQDAETTLHAYRDRARELKARIRQMESAGPDGPLPHLRARAGEPLRRRCWASCARSGRRSSRTGAGGSAAGSSSSSSPPTCRSWRGGRCGCTPRWRPPPSGWSSCAARLSELGADVRRSPRRRGPAGRGGGRARARARRASGPCPRAAAGPGLALSGPDLGRAHPGGDLARRGRPAPGRRRARCRRSRRRTWPPGAWPCVWPPSRWSAAAGRSGARSSWRSRSTGWSTEVGVAGPGAAAEAPAGGAAHRPDHAGRRGGRPSGALRRGARGAGRRRERRGRAAPRGGRIGPRVLRPAGAPWSGPGRASGGADGSRNCNLCPPSLRLSTMEA